MFSIFKPSNSASIYSKIMVLALFSIFLGMQQGYSQNWTGKWIWQANDGPDNTWIAFRKEVNLTTVPETVIANIGVDSKYWLYINDQLVKFEGGSARGPAPGNTWYDEVDIQPYLKTGTNTIAVLAWYWGRETFKGTHIDSGKGGLVFQADLGDFTLISDNTWKAKSHPAYDLNSGGGNNRIVPYNVHFDANLSLGDWSSSAWYTSGYDGSLWEDATEKGLPGVAPWGNLEKTYVKLKDHGLTDYLSLKNGASAITLPFTNNTGATITIDAKLPFNMQITPYLEIDCAAGKIIDIATSNTQNTITAKYTSKSGSQQFEAFSWMSGGIVTYQIPAGVTINALKYRWISVGDTAGNFECDDAFYQRLWWMGRNTLFVNARDNFMDCPDRERSLWIGDVSDQASYLFYTMDENGRELLKKAIRMTMTYSLDGGIIRGQVPGGGKELPTQSLQFISQAIWQYYLNTGDVETLEFAYSYVKSYLALWSMNSSTNLINMRACSGDFCWNWVDWDSGNTFDRVPIFNALYYYALDSAKKMAEVLNKSQDDIDWYDGRIDQIKIGFNSNYWNGSFYSSNAGSYQDDRTNALAIITGLADSSKYDAIVKNVLVPNHFCSPHYEWMIEEAMCIAGSYREALVRMRSRYQQQVNNENTTTLNEYFTIGEGTDNHAWNAPNTILSKHIAGIAPVDAGWSKYKVYPNLVHLSSAKQVMSSVKGDITVDINLSDTQYQLDLISPVGSVAVVGIPKANILTSEIKVNGALVWQNGNFIDGVSIIGAKGEDDEFIWFELNDGNWTIIATGVRQTVNYINFTAPFDGNIVDVGTDLVVRAEAGSTTTNVALFINGQLVRSITSAPYVWGLDPLEDVSLADMQVGDYTLKLVATDNESKLVETIINITCTAPIVQLPYEGIIPIPGTIEVENYDLGGESIAYHDADASNKGGIYRTDNVDIDVIGDMYHIGWTANGEWLEYTVDVAKAGIYDIDVVYSAGRTTPAKIGLELFDEGTQLFNNFTLPITGSWSTYKTITVKDVNLTEGNHIIRLNIIISGCNIDKLIFRSQDVALGLDDEILNEGLNVFPVPSNDGGFQLSKICQWEVFSVLGLKLKEGEGMQVDLSHFSNGMYLLRVDNKTLKLLKQ
ncbi:Carbohydrate binding module (family 6) [Lutibacter agarilyticus]|uniref:Carbohydrate binding module (Family 6) n=1 Tax=Lutibacter agarilyticus TaxID=1109740 RepID=A0A238Z0V7_9FLAO|nr:carbohydrate-binding protein [Lutibacter agarilyticus]SNR76997.1 Carbohydrate binding module (family 6) [Lutibacter agarilyticus]